MLKLPAKLAMGRITSSHGPDFYRIRVADGRSGADAIKVDLSMEQFALAVTGLGYVPCDMEFNDSGLIGKYRHVKDVPVPIPEWRDRHGDWAKVALAPFEVDGWKARGGDIDNHHRRTGNTAFVVFVRYMDEPQDRGETA